MKSWIKIDRSKLDPTKRAAIDMGIELTEQEELENINVAVNYTMHFPDMLFQYESPEQQASGGHQISLGFQLNRDTPTFRFKDHVAYRFLPNRLSDDYGDYADVLRDFRDYIIRLIEKRRPRRKQILEEIDVHEVTVKQDVKSGRNILQIKTKRQEKDAVATASS